MSNNENVQNVHRFLEVLDRITYWAFEHPLYNSAIKAIKWLLCLVISLIFVAALYIGVLTNGAWYVGVSAPAYASNHFESGIIQIGEAVFSTYVVPFEVLSLVLLAALIGAIALVLKRRDEQQ